MAQAEAGKGSTQRMTDATKYANNWELIFGKNKVTQVDQIPDVMISGSDSKSSCGNCSKCKCGESNEP